MTAEEIRTQLVLSPNMRTQVTIEFRVAHQVYVEIAAQLADLNEKLAAALRQFGVTK